MPSHARPLVSRRESASPRGPCQGWRGLLRAIQVGLTTSCSAAEVREQHELANDLHSRQIRPRRIAVLGSNGGVGTTTVAVLLASVLAGARADQTLLLTAGSDLSDSATRLALSRAPSVTEVLAGLRRDGRIPPTPLMRNGLRVLAAPRPGAGLLQAEVAALLEAAACGHACTVVDLGTASEIGELGLAVGCFDTVLLVTGTTSYALASTKAVLRRLRSELSAGVPMRVIVVPAQSRGRAAGGDLFRPLVGDGVTIRVLAHDAELASGQPIELVRLSQTSLTTSLTLAAEVMGARLHVN